MKISLTFEKLLYGLFVGTMWGIFSSWLFKNILAIPAGALLGALLYVVEVEE